MKIAFLILSHSQIELVYKQIDALSHSDHHFFIHLDKKYKININEEYANKKQVDFTNNRIRVNWGGFTIVQATLNLIQEAKSTGNKFDYFILMSDHCFPIKSSKDIRSLLKRKSNCSFIEVHPLPYDKLESGGMRKYHFPVFFDQLGFIHKDNFPIGKKVYNPKKLLFRYLFYSLRKIGYKRKIPHNLAPCFGSQWWILHSNAVNYVIEFLAKNHWVQNFFKYTWAPDELFFHTILYNSPMAKDIKSLSQWYIDWSANGPPKTLNIHDLDNLLKSKALMARKFDIKKSHDLIHKMETLWKST